MSALVVAFVGCLTLAFACWLLSLVTREFSWVDRAWSIAPPLYVLSFAWAGEFSDPRLVVMAVLCTAWGARLTYNFARKGGYGPGGEDYRWAELRKRMSPRLFSWFNVVFIAGFQNLLLLGLALPAWVTLEHSGTPIGPLDAVAAFGFVGFLLLETLADEQQWRFQTRKWSRKERGEPVDREFLTEGLFRYSRHPNFFAEQMIWWSFYLFSVASGGGWFNVSLIGPLALTLLFQGSTSFTESITVSKYPAYRDYQRRVSRLIPWRPRG